MPVKTNIKKYIFTRKFPILLYMLVKYKCKLCTYKYTLKKILILLLGLAGSIGSSQRRVLTSRWDVVTLQDPLKIFML